VSFTFDFKKLLENALRFIISLLIILCLFIKKNVFLRSSKRELYIGLRLLRIRKTHAIMRVWCLFVFNLDGINF